MNLAWRKAISKCFLQIVCGGIQLALLACQQSSVKPGGAECWIKGEGLGEVSYRKLRLIQRNVGEPAVIVTSIEFAMVVGLGEQNGRCRWCTTAVP
jgi:hypothetical protein